MSFETLPLDMQSALFQRIPVSSLGTLRRTSKSTRRMVDAAINETKGRMRAIPLQPQVELTIECLHVSLRLAQFLVDLTPTCNNDWEALVSRHVKKDAPRSTRVTVEFDPGHFSDHVLSVYLWHRQPHLEHPFLVFEAGLHPCDGDGFRVDPGDMWVSMDPLYTHEAMVVNQPSVRREDLPPYVVRVRNDEEYYGRWYHFELKDGRVRYQQRFMSRTWCTVLPPMMNMSLPTLAVVVRQLKYIRDALRALGLETGVWVPEEGLSQTTRHDMQRLLEALQT